MGESLAAARGVAQRDGVRRRIETDFVRAGVRARALALRVSKRCIPQLGFLRRVFFSVPEAHPSWRNDEFPAPGFVFGMLREKSRSSRDGFR